MAIYTYVYCIYIYTLICCLEWKYIHVYICLYIYICIIYVRKRFKINISNKAAEEVIFVIPNISVKLTIYYYIPPQHS